MNLKMRDLRKYLLEVKFFKAKELLSEISDQEEIYNFLCEFYTECDVKGVYLHKHIRKFIIDYVVRYRLDFASKNEIKDDKENTKNDTQINDNDTSGRVQLLKDLLNDNKDIHNLNPIEVITFFKTVSRVMRPLIFDKKAPKLPWDKIQFVICIFIATKIDRTRLPNWLMDNYYQLMVTEEFVGKLLRLLLSRLNDDSEEAVDWSELDYIFNITKMYYLVLKMYWNVQIFLKEHYFRLYYSGENERYCLQMVGECLDQLKKLNYEDFEDSSYMSQKMNLFSTILVEERHRLAHSHEISSVKVNVNKFILFVLELIQIVRSKIEEWILREFQTILEQSVEKLLERVNQISFTTFAWKYYKNLESLEKIYEILKDFNHKKYSAVVCDIGRKLIDVLSSPRCVNVTLLNLINNLKKKSKVLTDGKNRELSKEIIMEQLNQYSPQPFLNIKTMVDMFLSLIPHSQKKHDLQNWFNNLSTDYVMEEPKNADDETFIQNILIEIEKSIEDDNDKNKFAKKVSKLMTERCEFYENKIFKNSNSKRLRNNEIQTIIDNKYKNMSNLDIAEYFLKQIKWNNVDVVIDKMSKLRRHDLIALNKENVPMMAQMPEEQKHHTSALNNDITEMNVLNSFELARKRKVQLTTDYNFMDFDCPIPVGRNMRNYLAHGDICIDVLCPDAPLVIEEHFYYFHYFYENQDQPLGFSRPDDLVLVRDNFSKQMRWAREAWEVLNWNNDRRVLEKYESDQMAFRVRDLAGRTIVQYSLKDINKNNVLLNFLISKLLNTFSKEDNLLEQLFNCYVPIILHDLNKMKVDSFWTIDNEILDINSVSFFVNELYEQNMGLTLSQILCFNCQDLEIFKSAFSIIKPILPWDKWLHDEINYEFDSHCGLLQIAVAQNQTDIVNFLLEQSHYKQLINSKYKDFTALEYAIMNGNVEMASILIDNGADINHKSERYTFKMDQVLNVFKGEGLPVSKALTNNGPEMLSLLKPKRMQLDNEFIFDIQRKIKMNLNPEVWINILNFFCETKEDFEMFLRIACINEKFDIVKTIVDTKPLDWSSVDETILMSCYNLKSPDILEYLLHKGAVLKVDHVKLICAFSSIEVIEFLIKKDYLKEFSETELIGRNKEIVGALLNANFKVDWNAGDFLPLQLILEQNPSDVITKRITLFLMHSSSQSKMVKQLKALGIQIPLSVLEYAATELQLEKCKWLKECDFKETTEDWNEVLKTAVKCDHYLLARIALKRGADINVSIDNQTLLDFYIDKNEGKVSKMMKMLSEFKCPSRFGIDFNNFTVQDQLLFGHLTKNENMIGAAEEIADLDFIYSNFRDGTILHILYHYGIKLDKKEEESPNKNLDNCTAFDLFVINNPLRPLPFHFSEIAPFQRLVAGILRSDFEIMEDALESGADINSVLDNFNMYTPLHVAVRENLTNVVKFLLQKSASPNQMHSYQQLPIETSIISFDNDSMVNLLLQHMTTLTSDDLDYLLKLAERKGRRNVLKFLIQTKQFNLKTRADFEYALKLGLDINLVPNDYQETYLHIACYNSDFELVKFLLEKGADPLVKNCFEVFPVDVAVVKDDSSITELLLKNNMQSYNLEYFIELAFKNNSIRTAKMLLKNGADNVEHLLEFPCRMPNNGGLELANIFFKFDGNCKEYTKYFDEAVTNSNFMLAKSILLKIYQLSNINLYNIKDFKAALKNGIDFNRNPRLISIMDSKIPYLHFATFCCETNVVEFLLKKGANPLIKDSFNRIPIEYAIRLDDVEKVKLLFELKSKGNDKSNDDLKLIKLSDLLVLATESNSLKSVQFLIQSGFKKIKIKNKIIDRMLEIACGHELNKGLEIVKHILEKQLRPSSLHKFLDYSKQKNNFVIANLLISIINKDNCNEEPLSLSLPCGTSDTLISVSCSSSSLSTISSCSSFAYPPLRPSTSRCNIS